MRSGQKFSVLSVGTEVVTPTLQSRCGVIGIFGASSRRAALPVVSAAQGAVRPTFVRCSLEAVGVDRSPLPDVEQEGAAARCALQRAVGVNGLDAVENDCRRDLTGEIRGPDAAARVCHRDRLFDHAGDVPEHFGGDRLRRSERNQICAHRIGSLLVCGVRKRRVHHVNHFTVDLEYEEAMVDVTGKDDAGRVEGVDAPVTDRRGTLQVGGVVASDETRRGGIGQIPASEAGGVGGDVGAAATQDDVVDGGAEWGQGREQNGRRWIGDVVDGHVSARRLVGRGAQRVGLIGPGVVRERSRSRGRGEARKTRQRVHRDDAVAAGVDLREVRSTVLDVSVVYVLRGIGGHPRRIARAHAEVENRHSGRRAAGVEHSCALIDHQVVGMPDLRGAEGAHQHRIGRIGEVDRLNAGSSLGDHVAVVAVGLHVAPL